MFRVAIVGSRSIEVDNLSQYVPKCITMIVSGGAKGVDSQAEKFAKDNNIPFVKFKPHYEKYGKVAPIVRNKFIVEISNYVIIFWDGKSKGTLSVIKHAIKTHTDFEIHLID